MRVDVALQFAVAGALVLWFVASVLAQFGRPCRWVRRHFLGWCLPEWRLFAPEPAEFDYYFVCRTRSADGVEGALKHVPVHPRGRWRAVWNPTARQQKILRDIAGKLAGAQSSSTSLEGDPSRLAAYRLLLGAATRACGDGRDLQFAIFKETPPTSLECVFRSPWHAGHNVSGQATGV